MEKKKLKDGSVLLCFQNEVEYNYFMYYYNIGKDFEKIQKDTDV